MKRYHVIYPSIPSVVFCVEYYVQFGLDLDLCCSVDTIGVVFESDTFSLGPLYNVRVHCMVQLWNSVKLLLLGYSPIKMKELMIKLYNVFIYLLLTFLIYFPNS